MRNNVHSRSFFLQWQMLYAATNPGQRKDRWQVDGVDWIKDRHTFWGEHYSISTDVHCLTHRRGSKIDWEMLVVLEQWWGPDRLKGLRSSCWNKVITGTPEQILDWFKKQKIEGLTMPSDFSHDSMEEFTIASPEQE